MAAKSHENQRSPRPRPLPFDPSRPLIFDPPRLPFGSAALGPGLPKHGNTYVCLSRRASLHFLSWARPFRTSILHATHWEPWPCLCVGRLPQSFFQGDFTLSSTEQHLSKSELSRPWPPGSQKSTAKWSYGMTMKVQPKNSWWRAPQSFSTHSQLPLLVTPPPLPSSTSSFRSLVPCRSPPILTAILKSRFHYNFYVLQINQLGFRVFYNML